MANTPTLSKQQIPNVTVEMSEPFYPSEVHLRQRIPAQYQVNHNSSVAKFISLIFSFISEKACSESKLARSDTPKFYWLVSFFREKDENSQSYFPK